LLCQLFCQQTSPSSAASMPLYVMTIFIPFRQGNAGQAIADNSL
jgi:hypothetical protein